MASWKVLLLVALLASTAFYSSSAASEDSEGGSDAEDDEDYGETERAHLIVRKYFKDDYGVQGRNITVYFDIYNAGVSTAKNVELKDARLPAGLTLVDGSLTKSISQLDVGEKASHTYVVSAKEGSQRFVLQPAKVTYKAEMDSKDQQVGTSTRAVIYVLTPVELIQRYALNAGRYATLGVAKSSADWRNLAIIVAVVGLLFGGNQAVKSTLQARSSAQRKKALASLEKDE